MRESVNWCPKSWRMLALLALLALPAMAARTEWPVEKAELKALSEEPSAPKTLTMLVESSERLGARPSALVLKEEEGSRPTRFEIIAQSDQSGRITYRAQKQTPRGVKVLEVEDRSNKSRAGEPQFEWEVTMIDEDGVSQKLGGNPRPTSLSGQGFIE